MSAGAAMPNKRPCPTQPSRLHGFSPVSLIRMRVDVLLNATCHQTANTSELNEEICPALQSGTPGPKEGSLFLYKAQRRSPM